MKTGPDMTTDDETIAEDETNGRRPAQVLGRRRDTDRTRAILTAASDLLFEVGYDNVRIQDVAERACAGTGAIYRRWATKDALLAEAIRTMDRPETSTTDDPVADLHALIVHTYEPAATQPDLMPGIVSAMRASPEIAAAVRSQYAQDTFRTVIARVVGEQNPHLELLAELPTALILNRTALSGQAIDLESFAAEVVAIVELARSAS
jgi:AcrR family transcriptional regulator